MAEVYYQRLLMGKITFDKIPSRYKDTVKSYGKRDVQNGVITKELYEELFNEPYEEA